MTADIIAFGAPRTRPVDTNEAPEPKPARVAPDYGRVAKQAALAALLGAVKVAAFSAYVVLFSVRGLVRLILSFIGGLSLIMLIVAFFMPQDYEPRGKALIAFGIALAAASLLRILFDSLIYRLAPEGAQT